MKILTDTSIPVLHLDGRVINIWHFGPGRVLEKSQWYCMHRPLTLLDAEHTGDPRDSPATQFEAQLRYVDSYPAYVCVGLDIEPERLARILRNVQVLTETSRYRIGNMPVATNPAYHWYLNFEGNVQGVPAVPVTSRIGPWPEYHYYPVAARLRPDQHPLDLAVEALAAVSTWDILVRNRR
jgi:hypothetical protein